jgi:nucleotide-binding universal stress UspA family protein
VLTVPRRADAPARSLALGRLLCAVDFSPASIHALEYAAALGAPGGRGICALHVVEPFGATGPFGAAEAPDLRVELMTEARARLAAAVPPALHEAAPITPVVASGRAADEIVRAAAEEECDAIVLGIRGRSRSSVFLFGSTAQHVVRQAHCPVLTVRA